MPTAMPRSPARYTPSVAEQFGRLTAAVDAAWDLLDAAGRRAAEYATIADSGPSVMFALTPACPAEIREELEQRLDHYRIAVATAEEFEARVKAAKGGRR